MNPAQSNRQSGLGFAVAASLTLSVCSAAPARAQQPTLAYVTNTTSNVVQVVNLDSRSVLAAIPVQDIPVDIEVSPDGRFAYVSNRGANTVSVIDTARNAVVATIPVLSAPEGLGISPDGATLYVASTYGNAVQAIDTASNTVRGRVNVCNFPAHIAVAPNATGNPIYVTCRQDEKIAVIDTTTLTLTRSFDSGPTPWYISLSPGGYMAYVTNLSPGTVTAVWTDSGDKAGTIKAGNGTWGVLANPEWWLPSIYASNADDGTVSFISSWWGYFDNDRTYQVGPSNALGPYELALTPQNNSLVVPNYSGGTLNVYKIKPNSLRAGGTITLGGTPMAVKVIGGDV